MNVDSAPEHLSPPNHPVQTQQKRRGLSHALIRNLVVYWGLTVKVISAV